MNKTLPKNRARYHNKLYYVVLATLICGIMPGLMGLGSYIIPTQKVSAAEKTIKDITYMQELSKEVCDATQPSDGEATLIDIRDESDYTVAKLSDGKCWMTQNLRIVNYTTKADDSQTGGYTIPASSTSGFSDNAASNAYYGNNTTYGAYYTWCAATAGTCSSATTDKAEATGSICPKGWRLPKGTPGTGTNEFANMAGIPTTTDITKDNNFWSSVPTKSFASSTLTLRDSAWPAAGLYYNSSPSDVGSYGYCWSSTAYSSASAYSLRFSSSRFNPAFTGNRYSGFSVRCVGADIPNSELPMGTPETPELKDEKDANVIAVVVAPVISIDAAEGDSIEVDPNLVSTGTITARIRANTDYVVQLSAVQTSLLDSTNPDNTGIPTSSNVVAGTNAWGIQNNLNDNTRPSDYSPITTTPTTYYNTTETGENFSTTHTFTIGVSIAPNLPVGNYSTAVTITAVNN